MLDSVSWFIYFALEIRFRRRNVLLLIFNLFFVLVFLFCNCHYHSETVINSTQDSNQMLAPKRVLSHFYGQITMAVLVLLFSLHNDGTDTFHFSKYESYTMIFIIQGFWTIVFIFIVIFTTFWLICPLAFFRCLSNSGAYMELQTMSFFNPQGSLVLILLTITG